MTKTCQPSLQRVNFTYTLVQLIYWSLFAAFAGYQVNDRLMTLTNPGCMVQHCLPAHRGEEITAEVFEAHAQEIFDEAENRLHAQKAVLYLLMGEESR